MLRQFTETTGNLPIPVSTTTTSVQEQLDALKQIVTSWDGVLREITQSVFRCLATTTVGGLPYYTELLTSEVDLGIPRARLVEDQRVTRCPQLRPQAVHAAAGHRPGTGEIEQFYVPVTNAGQPPAKAQSCSPSRTTRNRLLRRFHNLVNATPRSSDNASAPDREVLAGDFSLAEPGAINAPSPRSRDAELEKNLLYLYASEPPILSKTAVTLEAQAVRL